MLGRSETKFGNGGTLWHELVFFVIFNTNPSSQASYNSLHYSLNYDTISAKILTLFHLDNSHLPRPSLSPLKSELYIHELFIMSTQALPQIPPRPSRSQEQQSGQTLGSDIPKIPPRPINKRIDRSQSPSSSDRYARSPLNEPNFMPSSAGNRSSGLYSSTSANASASSLGRPPSVVLPSIGQEGNEYADFSGAEDLSSSPSQTRSIANDLKLHAPKPSLPANAAKARVATVTRTDSDQAAAFGIGRPRTEDGPSTNRSLKSKASSLSINNGSDRPVSGQEEEHGIPIQGQRVPMYPNAGDVQAPSPSPYTTQFPPGIGYHNDGSKARHHGRRTSARGFEGPPGAYGLHGHGIQHSDRFEQAYYQKHPELLKKETPHYQEERAAFAMSSEDLNKIVRDTASRGAGMGMIKSMTI